VRVAVTGTGGRLGRAVLAAFAEAPFTGIAGPIAWYRPDYDLDDPAAPARLIGRDRPELIVHCAAWTDVDGCAREPELALRRNGQAVGELARAASEAGVDLVVVSTNEVFDGRRTDGLGYGPADPPNPINAYGASKLAGEQAARAAFDSSPRSALAVVRTAWLYGPPGNDFPEKIARASERARAAGQELRVVADETGSPTFTRDLAEGLVDLVGSGEPIGGTHHIVNSGVASRAAWARAVVGSLGLELPITEVPAATWVRASTPPAWAVLEPTALPSGEPLRTWQLALADYLPDLRRQLAVSAA
jgi:dTDP-4-dehydrorhamnose reductase